MKKFLLPILFLFTASIAFSTPFAPQKLTLSAPQTVSYNFTGANLEIPLTVGGWSSNTVFMIYTKGQAANIGSVQNGYLGWHYVNKMDTCVYLTILGLLPTGVNNVVWNGKGTQGAGAAMAQPTNAIVPAGDYTYYFYGYDSVNARVPAMKSVVTGQGETAPGYLEWKDAAGNVLPNPIMYVGINGWAAQDGPVTTNPEGNGSKVVKWPIGLDPETVITDMEYSLFDHGGMLKKGGNIAIDPTDHSMVYITETDKNWSNFITKYKWTPGGPAVLQTDWADNGSYAWTTGMGTGQCFQAGPLCNGPDLLCTTMWPNYDTTPWAQILILSREDGSLIKNIDVTNWQCSVDDMNRTGCLNGGSSNLQLPVGTDSGLMYANTAYTCRYITFDPYRDAGDEVVWVNQNGDYVGDRFFLPEEEVKWICNKWGHAPWAYTDYPDINGFSSFSCYGMGPQSFGLIGPSGTGVGYFAIAGETELVKQLAYPLNIGSAYDGMYPDNKNSTAAGPGTWYVGYDSITGTITNKAVGVADAAPAAFSVTQNVPNPFNPSTTISFNLAKAGKVTVDVFNISGQKVDTL
ncbi:MAG: hypothetical protein WCU00_10055, partial [Candidatus Latescibacterota bacterium]